ncbi:MAG: hypothetical protein O3C34_02150 [Proteobacteria bacterium]|nr:hypothetical protein [Pseudomonadota bacterium]
MRNTHLSFPASSAEPPPARLGRWLTLMAFGYGVFVLYGSLVPLQIRSLDLANALSQFSRISFHSLGTVHRADWVANILLYIPLAFFCCAAANARARTGWGTSAFILFLCLAFAVLIEFLQPARSPKTTCWPKPWGRSWALRSGWLPAGA